MGKKWLIMPVMVAIGLGGCAAIPTGPTVMVLPGRGRTLEQFQGDDLSCRQWAARQVGATRAAVSEQAMATSAVAGTALGAGVGAAIGAASGNPAAGAAIGAGTGLVGGTVVGLDASRAEVGSVQWRYDVAYEQCMYAKGHQIPVIMQALPQSSVTPPPPPPPPGGPTAAPPPQEPPR
jgi:hypothetical protein